MNKLSQTGKLIVLAIVIIVVIAVVAILVGYNGAPSVVTNPPGSAGTSTSTGGTPTGTTATNPSTGTAVPSGGTATPPKTSPILFVTPIPGETWTINTQNPVQWSHEAGVNGEIELLDASTYKLVGVILPVAGPHQTSYTWNTRDLFQGLTSPVKTTVVPGRYVIRIIFTGNHVPTVTSQPINIAN